ncbi:poly [ADP-ribose] polymerase 1-like [Diadema setosum]|uniref:poly [ADP-ribose] polymerase 1-like n=1 Tax=Diadema setosum TaxID=31175 RepID=UPI003B3A4FBD
MADDEKRDRPFRVEYAKSNRSSCKGCRSSISKDSLRLAKMVQSPVFDGKIPNWFHYNCFFKKNKPTSQHDIGGFASLRWDDQQRIKDSMAGKTSSKPAKSADPDAETDNAEMGDPDRILDRFCVEYARSGRSKCRICGSNIADREMRIAFMEEQEEESYGPVARWHHVDCFIDSMGDEDVLPGWPPSGTAKMLSGFKNLTATDKKTLQSKFGDVIPEAKSSKKGGKGGPPAKKAAPKLSKLEKDLKAQMDKLWEIRDQLYRQVNNSGLKEILEANGITPPTGESNLLNSVADGMMFGILEPCKECSNGQIVLSGSGLGYRCMGNISSWTKCQFRSKDVPRKAKWEIPEYLKETSKFLESFKFKPYNKGKRLFPEDEEPSTSASSAGEGKRKSAKKKDEPPLHKCTIVLHGKLSQSNTDVRARVQELGGEVSGTITPQTACVISTEAEVKKMNKKMREAKANDVHVVSEDFLDAVKKGGAALMISQHSICSWGSDPTSRITATIPVATKSAGQIQREKDENKFAAIMPKSSKMQVKGGGVVDPDSGLEHVAHVYKDGSQLYSATLGLVDITRGTNSYYKLQLLERDGGGGYWVFRAWGRVGTTIGGKKTTNFPLSRAKEEFKSVYLDKTGNLFGTTNFVKHPMKFFPLDISYGEEEERIKSSKERAGKTSKLPAEIQDLLKMIFDLDALKKTMLEFEIDLEKMPLGKLSKKQIEEAYSVLTKLQKLVTDKAPQSAILDASNRFYTLIPHNFGLKSIPLLDSLDVIQTKTQMLDNLLDIEIAYAMLKDSGDEVRDPIDVNYEKLKCPMEVVDKNSDEYKMVADYTENTHAPTHNWYHLEPMEVFRLDREGETARFKPFKKLHNRQLLWHGSRLTNYGGILSQGLRIAPPEAPATGYMFGKGIYFADMVTKSANYCFTNASNNIGLMLLSEVALGDMYELRGAQGMSKPPAGKHSTKGMGRTEPDPTGTQTVEDNLLVPMGKGMNSNISYSSLLYNEYIVYDVSQVKLRYLIKMKFNYNC